MESDMKIPKRNLPEALHLSDHNFTHNIYTSTWRQDTSVSSLGSSLNRRNPSGRQQRFRQQQEPNNVASAASHTNETKPALFPYLSRTPSVDSLSISPLVMSFSKSASLSSIPPERKSPAAQELRSINKSAISDEHSLESYNTPMVTTKAITARKNKNAEAQNPRETSLTQNMRATNVASNHQGGGEESDKDRHVGRKKSQTRSRPWAETAKTPAAKKEQQKKTNSVIEVHYEKALPPDRWAKSDSKKYAKNHKWGASYIVKVEKGKPLGPGPGQWLKDDGFRMWLLEKARDQFMAQAISRVMDKKHLKRVKGKTREEQEVLSTQKTLYTRYQTMQEEMKQEEMASLTFQKMIRGWIQRMQMKKLKERVLLEEGRPFGAFMSEYRGVVCRIMQRQDQRPQAPFDFIAMNDYLDRKAELKRAFIKFTVDEQTPGYLPVPSLSRFFEQINLGVTDELIERVFDIVFMVCRSKADVVLLVDLPVSLGDETFRIQSDFMRELVKTLHVGKNMVRVGYLPYNSEVFVSFKLGAYNTREEVLKALDKVRYSEGINRTDLAIRQMRTMFREAKYNRADSCDKRVAVIISEGGHYASHSTVKQAQEAIKRDNIVIYGVVLGKNANKEELVAITGDEDKVMVIPNYYSLWKVKNKLLHKANIRDCRFCDWQSHGSDLSSGRGLTLEETRELVWQISPPGVRKRQQKGGTVGLRFFNDDEDLDPNEDGNGALYDPCLGFIIKSRLEHQGIINLPEGGTSGTTVPVRTWREALERAKGFKVAEEKRMAVEEEEAAARGYPENIIQAEKDGEGSKGKTQE